jgi:hypothetical protein
MPAIGVWSAATLPSKTRDAIGGHFSITARNSFAGKIVMP